MCSWELAGGEENFQKGALIQGVLAGTINEGRIIK